MNRRLFLTAEKVVEDGTRFHKGSSLKKKNTLLRRFAPSPHSLLTREP